mmetsp:Transcript_42936/g.91293  ORF Transcript_42936/g.91293 Transcript_42936/m.91293 type:complete len:465 (+) Transcript_42936:270-1664(+)|eukprot:CAMPEP_0172527254 /NCGR_PEP_ID=MMETSP1067-20121228/1987_1 /TAXON_ID=265564 ORGANISM="Thalassiosira punctigera, Strain Tpunct2005C2" /NCGR_SAMPLE_ID=MMETSP1067 /ASSEMBLY_ACC=CAM_ASM_000444 /LENGTH=464 /DNA_ID=CAMNT_0013310955 /DNA_START=222 /DNA_END=1616 /DNA_ORIENTATION=-
MRRSESASVNDESQSQGEDSLRGKMGMHRTNSFAIMKNSVMWLGEQAQTQFLDRNLEAHKDDGSVVLSAPPSPSSSLSNLRKFAFPSYSSTETIDVIHTIRFQIIIWSISAPDVKTHRVSMKFRITMFWNDQPPPSRNGGGGELKRKKSQSSMWMMSGRSTAYQKKMTDDPAEKLDVPPVSILNADSFEVIGMPDVQLLREDTRLHRWSCMYRAQLLQNDRDMSVREFPHDEHDLCLKVGIISQRHSGGRWDRRKWKIGLANENDTQGSIRIPYGLMVDHVKIPEFYYEKDGLKFELAPLNHGADHQNIKERDYCLAVKLRVKRNSGYYDKNIMPFLSMLNLVSIGILAQDADNDFQRSLLSLNIAFVEVGLRMTLDSHLPSVGYQIKLQRILNRFFYSILTIVLESSILKFLIDHDVCSISFTRKVDLVMVVLLLMNQAYLSLVYTSFHRLRQTTELGEEDSW